MAMVVFLPLVCALDLDLLCRRYQPVVVNPTCVQAVQDEIVYTGRRVSPRCYCCLSRCSSRRCPAPNPRWGVHEVMKPQVDARKHPGNHAAPISCQDGPRRRYLPGYPTLTLSILLSPSFTFPQSYTGSPPRMISMILIYPLFDEK